MNTPIGPTFLLSEIVTHNAVRCGNDAAGNVMQFRFAAVDNKPAPRSGDVLRTLAGDMQLTSYQNDMIDDRHLFERFELGGRYQLVRIDIDEETPAVNVAAPEAANEP
jgi:hypothetical protein